MSKIIILNHEYLTKCSHLYSQVFSNAPWNEPWNENSAKQRLQETFDTPGFLGVGYIQNNEIYGFAIGFCEHWLEHKHFYLKEMCIDSAQQGKGIGTALLNQLKQQLKLHNVKKIYLLTMHQSNAHHFYRKHGFAESEKLIVMGHNV